MADIVSNEETEITLPKPKISYEELQKAYDELLDNSQILSFHYASLKKSFQKLSPEVKNLKSEKEKLRHEKDMILNENNLLKKDVNAFKAEVFESAQKTSYDVLELQKIVKLLKSDIENMVNGSKNLDLMLGNQRPYLKNQDLVMRRRRMNN